MSLTRKTVFFTGITVCLVLTMAIAGFSQITNDANTKVEWGFKDSASCGVAIDVHEDISINNVTLEPDETLNFSSSKYSYAGNDRRKVKTESNCPGGYTLQVSVGSEPSPASVDVLEDFAISSEITKTKADSADITLSNTWNYFTDWDMEEDFFKVGVVNSADNNGENWGTSVNGTTWVMDYRYDMDSGDQPGESYSVELVYTVTSSDSNGSGSDGGTGGGDDSDDDDDSDDNDEEDD